jgi:Uma2 family endonuclease
VTKPSRIPFHEWQHLVLSDVSWELYEHLLKEIGDRPIRMTFDRGDLEIMAPLLRNERWRTRIGRMIETMALEINLTLEPLGSTTFKRKQLGRGWSLMSATTFKTRKRSAGKTRSICLRMCSLMWNW